MDRGTRRLVFCAATLLVGLFLGRTVVGALWDDAPLRRAVASHRASLSRGGDAGERPDRADVEAARALAAVLDARLEALLPALAWERPAAYDVPPGASPDLAYIDALRREQDALVRAARYVGRSVPADLGMPVPNPTGLEDVLEALRALHVVHLVVTAGLDAGIDAVDAIRVPPRGARRRQAGFLDAHPVEFDLTGAPAAVHRLLRALAEGETWLLLDEVRLEALDEDGETVRCRMRVATVDVDPDAEPAGRGGAP